MNSYEEKFKNLKDSELIEIVENRGQFNISSVKAAESELNNREIAFITSISAKIQQKELTESKRPFNRIKKKTTNTLEELFPSFANKGKYEKVIVIMSMSFILPFLLNIYNNLIFLCDSTSQGINDLGLILIIMMFFAYPISIYLFWKMHKVGWIVVVTYCSLLLASNLFIITSIWNVENLFELTNSNTFLNFIVSPEPMWKFVVNILFYISILWILLKSEMRDLYGID